jgi:hypothetical protein
MIVNKEECEFDSMVSTYNSLSNAPKVHTYPNLSLLIGFENLNILKFLITKCIIPHIFIENQSEQYYNPYSPLVCMDFVDHCLKQFEKPRLQNNV